MRKKGVSLIILVVTISVMLILVGVIISQVQEDNSIDLADKVTFQNNIQNQIEQFNADMTVKEAKDSNFTRENVTAEGTALEKYITKPSSYFTKYLQIQNGEVVLKKMYENSQDIEVEWIKELEINIGV